MTTLEIWLLAISLAMDCFTVSITSGIIMRRICWRTFLLWHSSSVFSRPSCRLSVGLPPAASSHLIEDYDHWIAFGLLAFLGGRMIKESFSNEDKCCFDPTTLKVIVTLAIATSIDALAIGISFAFVGMNSFTSILSPIVIIGFTSFVISTLGSLIGVFCGKRFNLRMELWGGLVLIIIGVKILIEHLFLS